MARRKRLKTEIIYAECKQSEAAMLHSNIAINDLVEKEVGIVRRRRMAEATDSSSDDKANLRKAASKSDQSKHNKLISSDRSKTQQTSDSMADRPAKPRGKQELVINLMLRNSGASLDDFIAATNWLPHSTRAALSRLRRLGYEIQRSREEGVTRYRLASHLGKGAA